MSFLTPTASLTEINSVLAKFNIPSWQVCPWVVEFNDSRNKTKKMAIFANKLKAAIFDQDTIEMLVKDAFDGGATISEGLKGIRQTGSVAMISGDWMKDLANKDSLDKKKLHVQLLFLKERIVYIYDPDWVMSEPMVITKAIKKTMEAEGRKTMDPRTRLTQLQGGARLRLFVAGLVKKGLVVNKVLTGGGGNDGFCCVAMCQKLLLAMEKGGGRRRWL
ncbi:hypothetical protein V496_06485 [Pseudogymnoascus sp. VKM F-4515 (FW-2607)]|nr:hypothetical protein V496_06485 [Pseudogymnoascus sp. VKM F-4515 (FW-2607)]